MNIKKLYQKYFHIFFSPEDNMGENALDLTQAVSLSWPFVVINKALMIIFVFFVWDKIYLSNATHFLSFGIYQQSYNQSLVFSVVRFAFELVCFPIFSLIFYWVWKWTFKFFAWILKVPANQDALADAIVVSSFSSHIFLLVPVLGNGIQKLAALFIMFQGARKLMGLKPAAAGIVVLFPYFMGLIVITAFVVTLSIFIASLSLS